MATPEFSREHVGRIGVDAKGVRFVVASTDHEGNYDGSDDPQFVLLLTACRPAWPAGALVSRTYLRTPVVWDDDSARARPLPLTKPMVMSGEMLTQLIRSGLGFTPAELGLTDGERTAIIECRAEIHGDTQAGLVYHQHEDDED